ncbi:hypothetical protein LJR074_002590 [Acidovorax sp. LjRoot74]|uniref:hypothetical protein n=1 Tax=Acidovorax sp. LjRoot74 TaxID=3342337 RepID=UPI003ECFBE17
MVKPAAPATTPATPQLDGLLLADGPTADQQALAAVQHSDDVVEYTLRCVIALAPKLNAAVLRAAEAQVREVFGGDEVWVGRRPDLLSRNDAIRRDYLAGERVALLSRRYQLTQRRILQILKT